MKYLLLLVFVYLLVFFLPHHAFSHSGGLASDGCHFNHKLGTRHCHRGKDGEKTLGYGQLTAVLVKAIQEQQVLIEALQKEVEELKGG